jgi:hypothetical protein
MKQLRRPVSMAALFLLLASSASGTPDLYIRDTPVDVGLEPNPDPGPMWVSEDIWVRRYPDPNYSPYPFTTGSPPWTLPAHEDPEYRDPKYGNPNYIYVQVTNRGTTASTGAEWLKLYWAKASTGLGWPTQWVDYMASNCGPSKLYGIEITKERENAATATAAERDAYRDAIIGAAGLAFSGDPVSFWHKQNVIHKDTPMPPFPGIAFPIHASLTFNPWHREFINRYEVMLQESNPIVKLLYWDWTDDPDDPPFNYFTSTFMGASGAGSPVVVSIGAPFLPGLAPPPVTRRLRTVAPPAQPDATVLANTPYPTFRTQLEVPNHNASHTYIGNNVLPVGSMSDTATAASDPFFFLLHGNVDRLWSEWQRNLSTLNRLDPNLTYAPQSSNPVLTANMAPWNGDTGIFPYTSGGGYIFNKSSKHPSVVFPPIYDTPGARLRVPALGVGQSIILEIPFFPPDPATFACFSDAGHVCLLARLINSNTYPHGMTTGEGGSVGANTQANNNIAWKNITVVDDFPGSSLLTSILVRNVFREHVLTGIRLAAVAEEDGSTYFDYGTVRLELHPELYELWQRGGAKGRGIEVEHTDGGQPLLKVDPEANLENILLPPDAAYFVKVRFKLDRDYPAPRGARPRWDLIQVGTPGKATEIVGGERFVVDFNKLVLSPQGAEWSYATKYPGKDWQTAEFDAQSWRRGKAALGFGDYSSTVLDAPQPNEPGTTYFRRSFKVEDPDLLDNLYLRLRADDGAAVYLNGKEIHRANLPDGDIGDGTEAGYEVEGAEEEVFVATRIPADLLLAGDNLIAAEIHQTKTENRDLNFDLELAANLDQTPVEPGVAFGDHLVSGQFQAGQPIPIAVDGFGTDGRRLAITVEADGRVLTKSSNAPLVYTWNGASRGPHRIKATATDPGGAKIETFVTINVLDNLPPQVRMSSPADLASLPNAPSYTFAAEASDPLGAIERVEFYIKEAMNFGSPIVLAGIAKTPPYTVTVSDLAPGHWMIWAIAYDTQGGYTDGAPIHIRIGESQHH